RRDREIATDGHASDTTTVPCGRQPAPWDRHTRGGGSRWSAPPFTATAAHPPPGRASWDGLGDADAEERAGVSTCRQARRRAERTPAGATVVRPTSPGVKIEKSSRTRAASAGGRPRRCCR